MSSSAVQAAIVAEYKKNLAGLAETQTKAGAPAKSHSLEAVKIEQQIEDLKSKIEHQRKVLLAEQAVAKTDAQKAEEKKEKAKQKKKRHQRNKKEQKVLDNGITIKAPKGHSAPKNMVDIVKRLGSIPRETLEAARLGGGGNSKGADAQMALAEALAGVDMDDDEDTEVSTALNSPGDTKEQSGDKTEQRMVRYKGKLVTAKHKRLAEAASKKAAQLRLKGSSDSSQQSEQQRRTMEYMRAMQERLFAQMSDEDFDRELKKQTDPDRREMLRKIRDQGQMLDKLRKQYVEQQAVKARENMPEIPDAPLVLEETKTKTTIDPIYDDVIDL